MIMFIWNEIFRQSSFNTCLIEILNDTLARIVMQVDRVGKMNKCQMQNNQ